MGVDGLRYEPKFESEPSRPSRPSSIRAKSRSNKQKNSDDQFQVKLKPPQISFVVEDEAGGNPRFNLIKYRKFGVASKPTPPTSSTSTPTTVKKKPSRRLSVADRLKQQRDPRSQRQPSPSTATTNDASVRRGLGIMRTTTFTETFTS